MIAAIGVDPGLSAGLACLIDGVPVFAWQGPGDRLVAELIYLENDVIKPLDCRRVAGLERYNQRPRQPGRLSAQGDAQELIGAVSQVCESVLNWEVILSAPGDVKKMFPNVRLVALGLRVTPGDVGRRDANDVNDAMRHALMIVARYERATLDRMLRERGVL